MQGRFESLAKFANLCQEAAKGEKSAIATLKLLQPEQLMSAPVVLKSVGSLFNLFQGASAGTVLETFIALVTGGTIEGGEGAAVDNLAGKNGDVYTSAKQYKNKHVTSQAIGGTRTQVDDPNNNTWQRGLLYDAQVAKEKNKKVWYISISKITEKKGTAEAGAVGSLEIKFLGIDVDDAANPTKFNFYAPDGVTLIQSVGKNDVKEKSKKLGGWHGNKGSKGKYDFSQYIKDDRTTLATIPLMEEPKQGIQYNY